MKWDSVRHSVMLEIICSEVCNLLWILSCEFLMYVSAFFFPFCLLHTFQRHMCWAVLCHRSFTNVLYVTEHFWQFYFNTAFVLLSHLFSLLLWKCLQNWELEFLKRIYCDLYLSPRKHKLISQPCQLNFHPLKR